MTTFNQDLTKALIAVFCFLTSGRLAGFSEDPQMTLDRLGGESAWC